MADDDADDTLIFKEALMKILGECDLVVASCGEELLQNLKDKVPPPPDYLFLDINMPGKTGYDCLAEIKNHPFYKNIKVIMLTTSNHPLDIERTYQMGADSYICKPFTLEGYFTALKKLLKYSFPAIRFRTEFVIN